jgi:hypothetical protein
MTNKHPTKISMLPSSLKKNMTNKRPTKISMLPSSLYVWSLLKSLLNIFLLHCSISVPTIRQTMVMNQYIWKYCKRNLEVSYQITIVMWKRHMQNINLI